MMPTATTAFGLALVAAFLLGLRHGADYDHIAAITDLGSSERRPAGAMRLGLLYALGHAVTVFVLGMAVIRHRASETCFSVAHFPVALGDAKPGQSTGQGA